MENPKTRWLALDDLRGLAILIMIPVNAAMELTNIPSWFKHAQLSAPTGNGMTIADFVMPAFLFALGISSSFSLRQRIASAGLGKTAGHALLRHLILFACGSIGWILVYGARRGSWEVLQMLGAVGALAFPLLLLPPWARLASAAAILAGVEILRPVFFNPVYLAWFESGLGGPAGTISLVAIPVAASALGESLRAKTSKARALTALFWGIGLIGAGMALTPFWPPNKPLLSLSYLLIATGAAAAALSFLTALRDIKNLRPPLLGALGRNPLIAYILSGLAILLLRAVLPGDARAILAWAACFAVLALLSIAALVLDKLKIHVRL